MHRCSTLLGRLRPAAVFFVAFAPLLGGVHLSRGQAPAAVASDTELSELEDRFKAIAEKVAPSVVAISASMQADDSPSACRTQELSSDKLAAFLSRTTRIVGTGFIIDSDGYILTNDHVIDDAEQLWVTTDDHHVYPAFVVGSDPRSDLAVLKIPGKRMPAVRFADGSTVRRGQWSIAVGNPYGLAGEGNMCVSVGVVSAVNRSLPKLSDTENRLYTNLIQTTAQINPGNSGGPLFDLKGEVIGINTAVIMPQKAVNGIGFAMPIDHRLKQIVDQLKQGKEVVHGYLGVIVTGPSEAERKAAGVQGEVGVRVDRVLPDSPACSGEERLCENDIILSIDGHAVASSDAFVRLISSTAIVEPVTIAVARDGKPLTVNIRLIKRQLLIAAVTSHSQRMRWGGLIVGPADDGTGSLQVFHADAGSTFAKKGIHEGSVISTVAGVEVHQMAQLQTLINDTPTDSCKIELAPAVATANAADDR